MTENVSDVWGGKNLPYLEPVQVPGEDAYPQYASNITISKEEFVQKLNEKYGDWGGNFDDTNCIEIKEYTPGKRVKLVKFGNKEITRSASKKCIWVKIG